jgi:hypothetical protein
MTISHHEGVRTKAQRPRRRALTGAAAGVAAVGALTAAALAGGAFGTAAQADPDQASAAVPAHHAVAASEPSAAGARGLAGKLAVTLEGQGEVSGLRNWFPWGEKAFAGEPTLPDGSPGHGGEVLLDGSSVAVLVSPRTGPECGARAGDESNCHAVPGGFLQTNVVMTDGADGPTGHYAAYYSGDISVFVEAEDGVLDVAALTELAQDPVWTK